MKTRGSYILYLLILCVVVGCKGTSSPSTASETDEYAGTCEGEKAKAILWVDYKRGRKITDGTPIPWMLMLIFRYRELTAAICMKLALGIFGSY